MSEQRAESVAPTLHDLLETARLGLSVPADTAQDLGRTISWVHTTEMPDPSRYLRGGELVCTVGISLNSERDCTTFVDALVSAGAAGVCFGVGDGHDTVPAALLQRCRQKGLPVLVAPPSVPFSVISRFVAEFRLGHEIAVARATNALVPELLLSLRRHDSPRQLLDAAGQVLGCYFLLEPDGSADGSADGDAGSEDAGVTVPVPGMGTLVWMGRGDRPEPALLDLIARFVRAAQGERDIEAALTRERVGQLLSLVERRMLLPDALSQVLEWPGFGEEVACSARPAGAGALLSISFPDALIGDAPDLCLMLTVGAAEVTDDLALPTGHSAPVPLPDLGSAIAQARIALGLAEHRGGRVGPDQLSTLESLLEQLPLAQLAPFRQLLVDPLTELDSSRGTQHVRTLRTFVACNGSLSETAKALFLHTNTVRHRLSRIQEITGRDPLQHNDLTAFVIGMWAAERAE